MGFIDSHILSFMTFLPLLGAAVILCVPKGKDETIKWIAALASFLPLLLSVRLWFTYDRTLAGVNVASQFQFVEHYSWIPSINVEYFVGADGISMPMLLLTALLSFLAVIGSWGIDKKIKGYMALFLLLETGMMGVFVALDFFLFYVFWEVMLLPMYFLIGVWGGPRKEYAAIKFFLYTLVGSVLMLIVLLALYFNTTNPETGAHTFNLLHYMAQNTHNAWLKGFDVRILLFLGLFIGFAIKVPLFPFHTWLPDAHVEAPTAISVILAGVLLKMGTYGMMRISFPIFPDVTVYFAVPMAILGVINIIYGALCAMAQSDLKKLVAYSSVSHMGFVPARHGGADAAGDGRRVDADVLPRHDHRHALLPGRRGLRPGAPPPDRRLRRPGRRGSRLHRLHRLRVLRLPRAARAVGLHRRADGLPRLLPGVPDPGDHRRRWGSSSSRRSTSGRCSGSSSGR